MKSDPGRDGQAPLEDDEAPAIYAIHRIDGEPSLDRRSFLEIAAVAGGAAALAEGCSARVPPPAPTPVQPSPTPTPTPTPEPARKVGNAHKSGVTALAVNAAGTLLASGDKNGTVKLWQLPEGVLLQTWFGHPAAISHLAFPHAGDAVWSLAEDGNLKRWHLPDGKELSDGKPLPVVRPLVRALAVPEAADWYAAHAASVVEIRKQATGEKLRAVEGFTDEVTALAATADGRLLVAGGRAGKLGAWTDPAVVPPRPRAGARGERGRRTEPPAPTVKLAPAGSASSVKAISITQDGNSVLTAHAGRNLQVWSLPDSGAVRQFEAGPGEPYCLAIRPQQDLFAVGSEKPDVALWPLGGADATPRALAGHMAAVRAVAITPDGSLLISGSDDKTIRLWSLPDGEFLRVLVDLESNTKSVEGVTYQGTDIYGRTLMFTLPCGSPIPPGAVCVCNCVPGSLAVPDNYSQKYNSSGYCTCDTVCTCNTICTCQSVGGRQLTYWYPN